MHEVLIEESVIGWKEFELEVMRDVADNFVVICSIENIDPMGVHTGDSITVAPILTLSDKEYQRMRDAARRIIRKVGVETGGSNIQFAVNPANGRMVVIEMNPRVSRSSALASKATGFPIAKIAAKLALGYHLDEIPNDITRVTPASFEPTIDYVVVKIPRWNFEKFPQADRTLTTQMKSVGEAMAIGRTFKEAFMKGVRSLELGRSGLLFSASADRAAAIRGGRHGAEEAAGGADRSAACGTCSARSTAAGPSSRFTRSTKIDPWFLRQFAEIRDMRREVAGERARRRSTGRRMRRLKRAGFGDAELALAAGATRERGPRRARSATALKPVYKRVDTCAAEFESFTPYLYSSYEPSCEANPERPQQGRDPRQRAEPDRPGHRVRLLLLPRRLRAARGRPRDGDGQLQPGDGVDRLRHRRSAVLPAADVRGRDGASSRPSASAGGDVSCLVQFGGQTPLKLALALQQAGVRILGTSPDSIDLAEDRKRFAALLSRAGRSRSRRAARPRRARKRATWPRRSDSRSSSGRRTCSAAAAMAIVYDVGTLDRYMTQAVDASPEHPILIDKFLEDAFEFDVDAIADATGAVVIGGIMEHIEEAGIHSGDSSCVVPPFICPERHLATDPRLHAAHRARAEGRRPDERAVRDQGRRRLRARGEPARVAHGAVPVEGEPACRWPRSPPR